MEYAIITLGITRILHIRSCATDSRIRLSITLLNTISIIYKRIIEIIEIFSGLLKQTLLICSFNW